MDIDQIILGDNQFWGVNHASQDRGRETEEKFSNLEEIRKLLHIGLDNNVRGVMLSTHPLIYEVTDMIRADARLAHELRFYVNVPYIVKYVRMVSERGAIGTLRLTLGGESLLGTLSFLFESMRGVLTNDYLSLTNRLVDIEMKPFRGLTVKAIFLHNALTDLAIGYGLGNVLKNFAIYVKEKYDAIPGFGTLNLPALNELLAQTSVPESLIMAAVNKNGFLMNPSRTAVEECIVRMKHTVLAMGTLASGSLLPEEAYQYLGSLPSIKHVVVGVSTKAHAVQTFSLARAHLHKLE